MHRNQTSEHRHDNDPDREVEDGGQGRGFPAASQSGTVSFPPAGRVGINHWQEATISKPGLDDRGTVFFAAVEMTRMPMILTDPNLADNPIVFANRAFFDLTGYGQDEIIGRNCRFLQGAQTDRSAVAELREAVMEEHAVSLELLNYKRDGTPFWNAVFVAPVHDEDGKLLYFFASQLDVTRRRTSEQAFRQAQKMESIGQLTAGLAHDFNNLLQVILGNLEFLDSKIGSADVRRHVLKARDAAERGTRLTKQLLAFARKTRLEPRMLDVSELVHGFGEMLESTLGSQVDLQLNLRRRLPPVLVDPVHLEMALLNVVINARDAMDSGGTLTISTLHATSKDDVAGEKFVAIAVEDDGAGMPAHVLERATEPFFTTKDIGKGTGLGLAMVHGFVNQSLGRLEIESEQGRGTTVRMLFPANSKVRSMELPEAAVAAPARPAEPSGGATETILIVEDNEDVLTLAHEHLAMLGYQVLVARSGNEALALLDQPENRSIDLLFTDILMPGGMNGIVLAEKASQCVPGIAVLFTTGYNEDLVPEQSRPLGADVLGKPYRRSDLADRVRAALNQRMRGIAARNGAPRRYEGPRHEG